MPCTKRTFHSTNHIVQAQLIFICWLKMGPEVFLRFLPFQKVLQLFLLSHLLLFNMTRENHLTMVFIHAIEITKRKLTIKELYQNEHIQIYVIVNVFAFGAQLICAMTEWLLCFLFNTKRRTRSHHPHHIKRISGNSNRLSVTYTDTYSQITANTLHLYIYRYIYRFLNYISYRKMLKMKRI